MLSHKLIRNFNFYEGSVFGVGRVWKEASKLLPVCVLEALPQKKKSEIERWNVRISMHVLQAEGQRSIIYLTVGRWREG